MTIDDKPVSEEMARRLAEEGRRVRSFIASNRSDTLLRIFDYLLQQSVEGYRPREAEIAEEVFLDGLTAPGQQGSRVRVGVYRLRKKLDLFYADTQGARLTIPQGEYGLVLETPAEEEEEEKEDAPEEEAPTRRYSRLIVAVVALLLMLNAVSALLYFQRDPSGNAALRHSPLWSPFVGSKVPTTVVMGDYFMFSSKQNESSAAMVIQDMSINSADAFYEYVTMHPGMQATLRNQDIYAVSAGILGPISRLSSYLGPVALKPATSSELEQKPDMMKSSRIIYVGALDALAPWLSGPLFQASGFRCGTRCYDIFDKTSGRRFRSDSPYQLGDRIVPRRDYGYIASFPGPSGNQIVILSGTGDAGVRQMVSVVTDPKMVAQLHRRIGGGMRSFEALYQVRTMFDQSYGSRLLIARTIKSDHIWDKTRRDP